jgi:hypothetical protein
MEYHPLRLATLHRHPVSRAVFTHPAAPAVKILAIPRKGHN